MSHLIIVQQVAEVLNVPFSTKPGDMKVFATTVLLITEMVLNSASASPLLIVGGVPGCEMQCQWYGSETRLCHR